MVLGPIGKMLAPIGLILVLLGAAVSVFSFIFILLDLTGDFQDRVNTLTAVTALPLVVAGAAMTWLGR